MPGQYMRGALIQFMPTFLVPLPNVIVFQYNPETITHTWEQAEAVSDAENANPLAVRGLPAESFSLTIFVDAGDMIADGSPVAEGIARVSGIYSRLAALEMLLFPMDATQGAELVGSVSAAAGGVAGALGAEAAESRAIPQAEAPVVLFVWGPGRIVPVRVTGLTITERLYDELLNPTHAEAQLKMRVLTPDELSAVKGAMGEIAKVAYTYSQGLRQVLAVANLANSVESIIGMLPF
jgi:hypothetical protein